MNRGILKLSSYIFIVLLLVGCGTLTDAIPFFSGDSKKVVIVEDNSTVKPDEVQVPEPKKSTEESKTFNVLTEDSSIIDTSSVKEDEKLNSIISDKQVIEEPVKETSKPTNNIKTSTTLDTKNLKDFNFDMIQKGEDENNTLLLVGGIQGDEPGGFMAASLISTHYEITKGSVWIIPNLNFYSIIKRSRGPFGDMNRKFADLPKSDPEYEIIQRIKKYISAPSVKLVLNLHDGSGYYRPMFIDKNHQPNKWGQTIVIDQEMLQNVKEYNDLYTISKEVVDYSNKHLLKKEDEYRIKNTHTRFKSTYEEKEMAKTLTYYAINSGKAAFGHETSKDLNVNERVYYKLLAIEKFMDIMGIQYKRKFDLTLDGISSIVEDDIDIIFDDTNVKMPLKDIRNIQKYFPIDKDGVVKYLPSNPLIKIIKTGDEYTIYYGNRRLTKLEADYSEHLNFETPVIVNVDGEEKSFKFGDTIDVKKYFNIKNDDKFRVNVIGYKSSDGIETGKNIYNKMFIKKYSVQEHGELYRVEFYKGKKFAGMVLVNYIR